MDNQRIHETEHILQRVADDFNYHIICLFIQTGSKLPMMINMYTINC